jgi:hypothetical protein
LFEVNAVPIAHGIYAALSTQHFMQPRWLDTKDKHDDSENVKFYFDTDYCLRSVAFFTLVATFNIVFSVFSIIASVHSGLVPWVSLAATHADYATIPEIPATVWRTGGSMVMLELDRWSFVILGLVFFGTLGFTDDATEHYLDLLTSVGKWFRSGWFIAKAAYTGIRYVLLKPLIPKLTIFLGHARHHLFLFRLLMARRALTQISSFMTLEMLWEKPSHRLPRQTDPLGHSGSGRSGQSMSQERNHCARSKKNLRLQHPCFRQLGA